MSSQLKVRKASNKNKSTTTTTTTTTTSSSSSSSGVRSKVGSICGKKTDQILSSSVSSSVGNSSTDKSRDKEAKKALPRAKAGTFTEKAEIAYASYIQKLYLSHLLDKRRRSETETQRVKSETEKICFSDLQAETIKLHNEISTVKRLLKEASSLQEHETRIEELENILMEVEGDLYQLEAMLRKVNVDMKIAGGQVPLTVLKVTDASRDEFLSKIQELSNIRNEITSIMKHQKDTQMCATQNIDTCVSTVIQLRSLIKECCSILPLVVSSYLRVLSLQLCQKHQDPDLQLEKIFSLP